MSNDRTHVTENGKPAAEADRVTTRMDQTKAAFAGGYEKTRDFVKRRPWTSGAVLLALTAGGLTYGFSGSSKIPLTEAGLPTAQASKTVRSGQTKDVDITVLSGTKKGNLIILNNSADYKTATMSVVIDLQACPELGTVDFRSLRNKKIHAHGEYQTYDGRPQVVVRSAGDLTIDPKAAVPEKK